MSESYGSEAGFCSDGKDGIRPVGVPQAEPGIIPPVHTLGTRLTNSLGTPRRFLLNHLRPGYVQQNLARRQGDCNRCGLCCQLVVKCVFLRYDKGLASCARYDSRPGNCSNFPFDQADIDDVNAIAPHMPCGYSFKPPCGGGAKSACGGAKPSCGGATSGKGQPGRFGLFFRKWLKALGIGR